jgi:hypothetical protein
MPRRPATPGRGAHPNPSQWGWSPKCAPAATWAPPGSAVGVDEQGEPWFADGVTGGIASLPSARPLPERLTWTDPSQLHAAWDIPLLCGAARRLGAALGAGKLPAVCQGPE